MSNQHYKLYIEDTLQLAETIVLKSEYEANSINDWIILNHGIESVDVNDKTTWKYYLNICGEYHPTDPVIQITSLDTVGNIIFNKNNLSLHPNTKKAYAYGSRYYRELLLEYPDQEELIFGILYPAEMTQAIAAKEGTILSYIPNLVEPTEVSFISKLQDWIYKWWFRWYNIQFTNNHNLYYHATKVIMHLNMVQEILNIRLRACRTDEVHTFHIRQYLGSHNYLDDYLDFMTRKQALFFYRNIAYIERNAGKQDTFYWLVEKVLTDRGIPLSRFTMRHDVSKLPHNYYPDVTFRKSPVNSVYSSQDEQETNNSLNTILDKEIPLAPYNADYIKEEILKITNLFKDSSSNVLQTKVLESSMTDYSDAYPFTLIEIAFNHWIYLSGNNNYTAYIRVINPNDGNEIVLTTKDAFIYYMYLVMKSVKLSFTNIPIFGAVRVIKSPAPTVPEMMQVVNNRIPATKAQEILDTSPYVTSPIYVSGFTAISREIYEATKLQQIIVSKEEEHFPRGMVENLVNTLYHDTVVDFTNGQTIDYENWVSSKSLPSDDLSEEKCVDLYNRIFEAATGVPLVTTDDISKLQKAMIGLLTRLSSYSIQILTQINNNSVRALGWAVIRPDDVKVDSGGFYHVEMPDTTVINKITDESDYVYIEVEPVLVNTITDTATSTNNQIEIPVKPHIDEGASSNTIELNMMNYVVNDPTFETPPITTGPVRYLPEYQSFYDLTPEDQKTIKSIYNNCFPDIQPNTHIDIIEALPRDVIESFRYLHVTKPLLKSFRFVYLPSIITNGIKVTISDDINGFDFTGATMNVPGFVKIGHEHTLDGFTLSTNHLRVAGIQFKPTVINLPVYGLHVNYNLGNNVTVNNPDVVFHTDLDFEFNIKEYSDININYAPDSVDVPITMNIAEKYMAENNGPFFGDPDTIGSPFYTIGSFIIDGDGKIDFDVEP